MTDARNTQDSDSGFLNIYKQVGVTSHDVVAQVRRALKIKQVGHAGTLDPFAEGVLPIAVGKATRLLEFLNDDKEYIATVKFGTATTTYDLEGEITFTSDKPVSAVQIRAALKDFEGEILQTPPAYSAIKVKGKKLYEYARKGETIEVEPRRVTVHEIELLSCHPALDAGSQRYRNKSGMTYQIRIACSKGTYIRSIAHELGQKLGVGAHLVKLVRTKAGPFKIKDTGERLINPLEVLTQPTRRINSQELDRIKHGQPLLNNSYKTGENVILEYNNHVAAMALAKEDTLLVKKVLLSLMLLALPAHAAQCDYTCVKPYDLSNKAARIVTSATGINLATQALAGQVAKSFVKDAAKSDAIKVKIKSFSPMDLLAGRFKSFELNGKNFSAEGIFLSSLNMKTLCDFNYAAPDKKNDTVVFKEDFPLAFSVVLSEDDLNNTMKSNGYDRLINDLNKLGTIKIIDTKVKIKNDRFIYIVKTAIPFVKKPQETVISSDLTIKNGDIRFTDTKLLGSTFTVDLSKAAYALNFLNPLDYSLKVLDNKDAKMQIKDVHIKNNMIYADGIIVMPKEKV
jgi:tRNA pseudouridine55 synthase